MLSLNSRPALVRQSGFGSGARQYSSISVRCRRYGNRRSQSSHRASGRELASQNGASQSLARESRQIRDRIQYMKVRLHAARLLCWKAAWLIDRGSATPLDISVTKLHGTRVAREICGECMDIAGRVAAGDSLILEKLFRDMKAFEVMEGTAEIHRLIIARGLPSQAQAAYRMN